MSPVLKYLPQLSFLFVAFDAASQVDFVNVTYNVRDTNVIFAKFENDFKLLNLPAKGVKIESKNCQVQNPGDTGHYLVLCRKEGIDTFYMIKNNRVIRTKVFHIKKFDVGRVQLGNIKTSKATKNEIIANRGLVVVNDCNCTFPLPIWSFRIQPISLRLAEANIPIGINGNLLSPYAIEIIKRLETGDIIEFNTIIVGCASGVPREYPPFRITIK